MPQNVGEKAHIPVRSEPQQWRNPKPKHQWHRKWPHPTQAARRHPHLNHLQFNENPLALRTSIPWKVFREWYKKNLSHTPTHTRHTQLTTYFSFVSYQPKSHRLHPERKGLKGRRVQDINGALYRRLDIPNRNFYWMHLSNVLYEETPSLVCGILMIYECKRAPVFYTGYQQCDRVDTCPHT